MEQLKKGEPQNTQQKSDGRIVHRRNKVVEVEKNLSSHLSSHLSSQVRGQVIPLRREQDRKSVEVLAGLSCKVIPKRKHSLYTETGGTMETKLARISQLSSENPDMVFTSIGHQQA